MLDDWEKRAWAWMSITFAHCCHDERLENMTKLIFSDGVELDTPGDYRTLKLHDGWYVIGPWDAYAV